MAGLREPLEQRRRPECTNRTTIIRRSDTGSLVPWLTLRDGFSKDRLGTLILVSSCRFRIDNSHRPKAHDQQPTARALTSPPLVTRGTASWCATGSNRPSGRFLPKETLMSTVVLDKKADLAGPGIGDYKELEQVLPRDYRSLLTPKETQQAIFRVKRYIEDNLCKELNLMMVEVPLIVDVESGVNDMLDRDGSRTPVQFHISNDRNLHPIEAQVVQAATKWKRVALKQFDCKVGEGICTDMRAVRKDYFLDHDHSAYVDQWDWERVITSEERNLDFLKTIVRKIWKVIVGAEKLAQSLFPKLK